MINVINLLCFLGHEFKGYHGHFSSQHSFSQNSCQCVNEGNLSPKCRTLHHHYERVGYFLGLFFGGFRKIDFLMLLLKTSKIHHILKFFSNLI